MENNELQILRNQLAIMRSQMVLLEQANLTIPCFGRYVIDELRERIKQTYNRICFLTE